MDEIEKKVVALALVKTINDIGGWIKVLALIIFWYVPICCVYYPAMFGRWLKKLQMSSF